MSDCFFRFTAGPHTKSIFIQPINIAMRYRDIQEATATRKLTHGTDRGRMNEIILATAIFSKFVKGDVDVTVPYLTSALKLLAKSPTGLRNKKNPDNDPIRLSIQDRGPKLLKDIQIK